MVTPTPENSFVFALFRLLLSGLILLVLAWTFYREKPSGRRRELFFQALAFLAFAANYLFETAYHLRELAPEAAGAWYVQADLRGPAEIVAVGSLAIGIVPMFHASRMRIAACLAATLLFAGVAAAPLPSAFQAIGPASLGAGQCAAAAIAVAAILFFLNQARTVALGLLSLGLACAMELIGATRSLQPDFAWWWNGENIGQLVALVLFAVAMERSSRSLYVRFFVRLNLIFLLLANAFLLVLAESERRQYLALAEQNVQDVAEFLRGHIIHFREKGEEEEAILSSPQIIHRIVADFGRFPDLRRIRVYLRQWRMEARIKENGEVDYEVRPLHAGNSGPPAAGDRRLVAVMNLPIVHKQARIGHIELDESLRTVNSRILRQMQVIFVAFTFSVFVAAVLIGLLLRRANRVISGQYQELEESHEQLLRAAKLASVGQLAGGMAHEINNPAGIILARADYLCAVAQEEGLADRLGEDLQAIRRQACRVSAIVRDLLAFSRCTVLDLRPVDLDWLVQQTVSLLSPRLHRDGIRLLVARPPCPVVVRGDADRLEQVLVNFVNNAADAVAQGGTIQLETGEEDIERQTVAFVRIRDTGCGIPPENLKRVFDPFFTTKKPGQGTGLGLSVSYGIVRDHGGSIEVKSEVNSGSTFIIRLPRLEENRVPANSDR